MMSNLTIANYGEFHTIELPDGQTIEIDLRNCRDVQLFVCDRTGDCYESVSIINTDRDDYADHPSLSAAERNSFMR